MSLATKGVGSWVSRLVPFSGTLKNGQPQRHQQPDNGNLWVQLCTNKSALVPFS